MPKTDTRSYTKRVAAAFALAQARCRPVPRETIRRVVRTNIRMLFGSTHRILSF